MAISILQSPQVFSPVYNELYYVVSSTNTAQANFKYVFDIYVNGVKVTRELRNPQPTYSTGVIDVKRIVSPSVLRDFATTDTDGVAKNTNSFVSLQVKVGEQYGPSTGIVTYENLATSNTTYAFAGAIKKLDFDLWDYTDYYIGVEHQGKFLTNRSRTRHSIIENQNDWLSLYTNASGNFTTVYMETFDYAGNSLQTIQWLNPFTSLANTDDRLLKIPSGYNINSVTTLFDGAQPALSAGVSYYTIKILDAGDFTASETITTYLDKECTYGTSYDIHFQNTLGFEETFRFTKWTDKTQDAEKREYLKNTGTDSATAFTLSQTDETYVQYFTKIDNVWVLRSDWVHDEMVAWFGELIFSPQVRINIDGVLIPVKIENTNYKEITKQTGTIPKLEITIKLPPDYRQLG